MVVDIYQVITSLFMAQLQSQLVIIVASFRIIGRCFEAKDIADLIASAT